MSCIRLRASARVIAGCCECERGHLKPRLGPAQGAVLDMHQLALKVASASRARLVGHVRPPRLPFPTSDGPPGGRWRSGFASTRLHAPAQPHTESPRSMRLKGALLERTRDDPPSLRAPAWQVWTGPSVAPPGARTELHDEDDCSLPKIASGERRPCARPGPATRPGW